MALLLFPISTNGAFGVGEDLKIKTIVIDAGHGGHDSGCLGHTRVNEKKVALNIALLLGGYIEEKLPDVKVIYTRKTDVFVELEERAAIANRSKADLFISIHCNAASPAAFGTETYVMGLHKTDGNLNVAKRENSVIELEDNYEERYGFDPNSVESYIMLSLTQNAYLEQSTDLASRIQDQFRERVGRYDRGVKSAGFWVLWRTAMPSVLVETGFLTNAKEEKFLNSPQGQDYIASALFRAFRDYKTDVEKTVSKMEIIPDDEQVVEQNNVVIDESPSAQSSSLTYRVQLLVSSKKYDSFSKRFKAVDKLMIEHLDNGLYRYSAGPYGQEGLARSTLSQLTNKGFNDAFITVYNGTERIQIIKNN
ncbi:MAG: N-acetylmuramoyl-L-alanine amidase [Bacteroidetes bacterium]|nr:N-acetylmuramoyl-L-alanine amidase [Bacteroidota bacterium]